MGTQNDRSKLNIAHFVKKPFLNGNEIVGADVESYRIWKEDDLMLLLECTMYSGKVRFFEVRVTERKMETYTRFGR